MTLTAKQKLFVIEYIIDLNGSAAYTRAYGAKGNVAEVGASRLLRNAKIKEEIDKRMQERAKDTGITANYVLSSLKTVAERCMQAEQVFDNQGNPTGEYKFDSSGANKSLELLGKHLKLFTDKVETEDNTRLEVIFNIPRPAKK